MTAETGTLLRYAGFVTWALTGLPLLVSLAQEPLLLRETRYWLWLACFLIFGVIFGLTGWRQVSARPRRTQIASLITQTAAALAMIRLVCSGQEGALLVIVAAQLGWVLPLSQALVWVFVQAAIMCAILGLTMPSQVTLRLVSTFLGFQVLGLFSCFLTAREAAARAISLARTANCTRRASCSRTPAGWLNASASRATCTTRSGITSRH